MLESTFIVHTMVHTQLIPYYIIYNSFLNLIIQTGLIKKANTVQIKNVKFFFFFLNTV